MLTHSPGLPGRAERHQRRAAPPQEWRGHPLVQLLTLFFIMSEDAAQPGAVGCVTLGPRQNPSSGGTPRTRAPPSGGAERGGRSSRGGGGAGHTHSRAGTRRRRAPRPRKARPCAEGSVRGCPGVPGAGRGRRRRGRRAVELPGSGCAAPRPAALASSALCPSASLSLLCLAGVFDRPIKL